MSKDNEEGSGDKKKLGMFVLIVNLILIVPVICIVAYKYSYKNLGDSNKAAKETLSKIEKIDDVKEKKQVVRDYDFVHQMSNNLIVAEDGKIRGNQDVTLENIEAGIKMLQNDSYIVEELNKWKEGNFDNAVELHNYCWRILDGNEGKAKSILSDGVEKAKKSIGKE
ncbi:MAG: DUF6241 domain-containing protein [Clostridium sp.]